MKILIINNLYPPYARGGAETVVELSAKQFANDGHEVHILTTKPYGAKPPVADIGMIRVHRMGGLYYDLGRIPLFLRLLWHIFDMFDPRAYFAVGSLIRKIKPDTVITQNLKGIGFLAGAAARRSKAKHIHTLHDIQLLYPSGLIMKGEEKKMDSWLSLIYQLAARAIMGCPDAVVSPSSWLLGEHEKRRYFTRSEKAVIPNPAPDPAGRGANARQTSRIDNGAPIDKRFRFLYVGQIEKHKGIDLLLAAFSPIAERVSGEAALTLVGGGSGFDSVRRDYSARQNIYFIGRRSREEVMASMAACDCLIVPSVCYENSPAVIYEAFSAGLPVMAAGIGGIGELLAEGRGLTFEPGSVESLRVKMDWALSNAEELRRMGSRGREYVRDLGADSYARKIYSLI